MGKHDSFCLVKKTQSVSLISAEAEVHALTTGISEGMVTKHLLKELGYEVTLVNHVDIQSAKTWASKRGLGTDETCNAELHGEDANDTCLCKHEFEQTRPDDKVSYI